MTLSSDSAFGLRDVSYSYNNVAALRGVSLQVRRGERIALLGANGSGKSTLLRLLSGLAFPDHGEISFFGEPLTEAKLQAEEFFFRFRQKVGVVFQNPDVQLFNASVYDEVAFGPLQMRWSKPEVRRKVEDTLNTLGIFALKDRSPHRLSGGEKKRVALASVLVLDPEVLLLDEPSAALDPNSQSQMIEIVKSWKGSGKTIITATHNLDTLEDVADRCYILDDGRLVAEGEPIQILHDVALLERSKLLRRLHHVHDHGSASPHPHVHVSE